MIIVAKFASTCPCCSRPITVGAKVEWSRGAKAVHVACVGQAASAAPTAASRPARSFSRRPAGRRNGCSCGARQLPGGGLSANACAQCRFDEYDC
jgi:hypothetical protein